MLKINIFYHIFTSSLPVYVCSAYIFNIVNDILTYSNTFSLLLYWILRNYFIVFSSRVDGMAKS